MERLPIPQQQPTRCLAECVLPSGFAVGCVLVVQVALSLNEKKNCSGTPAIFFYTPLCIGGLGSVNFIGDKSPC